MPHAHPDFDRILAAARRASSGPVLVLGPVDSGKTTLVRSLASALAAETPVLVVDADVGQSWIGPPATLGRACIPRPRKRWTALKPQRLVFFGATSPAPATRACADALVRLVRDARPPVLVDTPGLVKGLPAEALWRRVASRLTPGLVVAVRAGVDLGPVLRPFRDAEFRVLECDADPRVRVRRRDQRARYRDAAYRRALRGARVRWAAHARLAVRPAFPWRPAALEPGRLVGLRDAAGRDLAIGVVRTVGRTRLGVLTSLDGLRDVSTVILGTLCVDPATGREAPR